MGTAFDPSKSVSVRYCWSSDAGVRTAENGGFVEGPGSPFADWVVVDVGGEERLSTGTVASKRITIRNILRRVTRRLPRAAVMGVCISSTVLMLA